MKKLFLMMALSFLFSTTTWALELVHVRVKGMVCPFCAQGLEKKFKETPAVEAVNVDLNKKLVLLTMKEGKTLSDEEIKKLVLDAGYNVYDIKRDVRDTQRSQ